MREEVAELLANKKELLTITYFKLQKLFEKKYGTNTVVLMEIGTFFEVYEVNNEEEKIGKAKEIAELLNIQLTRKNKAILENSKENPIMAGVPAISFEKHLARIIAEQKYTVAIIRQRGIPPNVTRYLDTVVSPGTNFDFVISQDENNITSLLIDQIKGIYLVGYSAIDVTTGKCYYNEVHGTSEDKFFALDEVFNYMNMHKTNEIIVSFADKNINQKEVLDYLELSLKTFHIGHFRPKISYQNELFKNVFNIESLLTSIEHLDMERVPLSTESLAVLIDFVIGHDSNIIQKLSHPVKLDVSRYIYLGNNALEQLNIIETSHNPSLIKLINNTSTAMGRRLLKERLTHPVKDSKEILRRLSLSKELYDYHAPIENELANEIIGNSGSNYLFGYNGNDILNGKLGNDILVGGAGKDNFVFDTTLNATTNKDTIKDFNVADDTISLENAIFAKLTATGLLNSANFVSTTDGKAKDSNDYIVYNKTNGQLFYDADGNGAGASVLFAVVENKANLTNADFTVI